MITPVFIIVLLVTSHSFAQSKYELSTINRMEPGMITFQSSNPILNSTFNWAKEQALDYAFTGYPVGPWYEAALPGREAFCMRDVSHQSTGAQALGLSNYTENMLETFAKDISDSKDWCSYWEISKDGNPPAVDYYNNHSFWYDLPANFDVLDASYRMFKWTGDKRYIDNLAFLRFYKRTVYDYVERWDLGLNRIMKRKRIMNTRF